MTNNCVSTVFGVLGVLAALTFPAAPGNAAEAQTALGGKLVVCGVCHGVNGSPKLERVPIIWGLQENYILKQLHEFKRGDRASDTMKKIAVTLTDDEMGPQQLSSRRRIGRDPRTPRPPRRPPQWRYARLVISKNWLAA